MAQAETKNITCPVNAAKTVPPAQAPQGLARRSFLAGLAVTLPAGAIAATPALAAVGASRSEIDDLYAERTELAARSRIVAAQHKAAEASMPWWAQPGPSLLRGDGRWTGTSVGWPAIDNDKLPSHPDTMFNKRPSPSDLRKNFDIRLRMCGKLTEAHRTEARGLYIQSMRELAARRRRQREEEIKVGLPDLEAQLDAIGERLGEIDDRLQDLTVSPADAPQKAAAMLMIDLNGHWKNDTAFGCSVTLGALRPFLTGLISEHAEYAQANCLKRVDAMPFWSAA
jgi:hypothetical protein